MLLKSAILTFLVAMVPVIELRGAIPIGTAAGLPLWLSFLISYLGNLVPIPFIILFVRRIFSWGRNRFPKLDRYITRLENKALKKADIIRRYEVWGLLLFVAIPIPGTGAWTGSLIAAMFDIRLKTAFPVISLGVLIAGLIVSVITYGAEVFIFA